MCCHAGLYFLFPSGGGESCVNKWIQVYDFCAGDKNICDVAFVGSVYPKEARERGARALLAVFQGIKASLHNESSHVVYVNQRQRSQDINLVQPLYVYVLS